MGVVRRIAGARLRHRRPVVPATRWFDRAAAGTDAMDVSSIIGSVAGGGVGGGVIMAIVGAIKNAMAK